MNIEVGSHGETVTCAAMASPPPVLVGQPAAGVTLLTLNRPEKLNAMNAELVSALMRAYDSIAADRGCRVVILTGAGRGFCSGYDLDGYGDLPGDEHRGNVQLFMAMQQDIARLVPRMRSLPVPVIAAVNGAAAGGGLALVLASDIRFATPAARFNAAFVRIGLSGCDIATSWTLPRLVGAGRAHELMLTGRFVDADEAARIGLVLEVVDADRLIDRALEEAELVMRNSPMGVTMTKEVMWAAMEIPQAAAIDLENRTQVMLGQTADAAEAREAFLANRPPSYENH
jgi:enoyl-CoA hydratase